MALSWKKILSSFLLSFFLGLFIWWFWWRLGFPAGTFRRGLTGHGPGPYAWPLLIAVYAPLAHCLFTLAYKVMSGWDGGKVFSRYSRWDQLSLVWFVPLIIIMIARPGSDLWPCLISGWYVFFIGIKGTLFIRALWLFINKINPSARQGGAAVFIAGLLLYGFLGAQVSSTLSAVGDEPYYLLISHSLTKDGDWELSNNFAKKDYLPFYWGPLNPKQMMRITPDGRMYSNAYQGLQPILLSPGYVLGGRLGAILSMSLLSAACLALVFLLALRLGTSVQAAFLAWLGTCLSVPVLSFSISPFPEMTGAFFMTGAIYLLLKETRNKWDMGGIIFCLLAVMALKNRFVLLVLPLAIGFFRKLNWKNALGTLLVWLGMMIFTVWYDHFVFGGFLSNRILGQEVGSGHPFKPFIYQGHLGLLLDQEFGLLTTAPVFILALAGAVIGLVRGQWKSVVLLAGPFLCTWYVMAGERTDVLIWHGGFNPPARYVIASLPALGVLAAWALDRIRGRFLWSLSSGLFGLTLFYALLISIWPSWRYQDAYGRMTLLRAFFNTTGLDIGRLLPSFILPGIWWVLPSLMFLLLIGVVGFILAGKEGGFVPGGSMVQGMLVTAGICFFMVGILALYPCGEYPATLAVSEGGVPFRGTIRVEGRDRHGDTERVVYVASNNTTLEWAPRVPAGFYRFTAAVGTQSREETPLLGGRVGELRLPTTPLTGSPPPTWRETEWEQKFSWSGGRLHVHLEISNISKQDSLRMAYVRWIRIDRK